MEKKAMFAFAAVMPLLAACGSAAVPADRLANSEAAIRSAQAMGADNDPKAAREDPVFEAVAVGPQGVTRTVDGDELGRFCLPVVPEDATELRVTNGDLTIVAALDLRGPEPVG